MFGSDQLQIDCFINTHTLLIIRHKRNYSLEHSVKRLVIC